MKFFAVIFDEPKLGKICCGRTSNEGYFMFVGKFAGNVITQITKDELSYFHTITDKLYNEKVLGHTYSDGSVNKEIEIDNEDKDFLLTMSGIYFNNENPCLGEMYMEHIIGQDKKILIVSESDLTY